MCFTCCPVCHTNDCPGCSVEPSDTETLATRRMDGARTFYDLAFDAGELRAVATDLATALPWERAWTPDGALRDTLADEARDGWMLALDALGELPGEWRSPSNDVRLAGEAA